MDNKKPFSSVKRKSHNKRKAYVLKELFGAVKLKKPTEQIIKELREELESR